MKPDFTIERVFNVPVEKVWAALTEPEAMKQWYFDIPVFVAEVGFEFEFRGQGRQGEQYLHLCRVTLVVPGKKLQYSWRYHNYEGMSYVTFELFDEHGKTRLKLTHEGLDSFPKNNADFAPESFAEGWTYLVTESLDRFFAGGHGHN